MGIAVESRRLDMVERVLRLCDATPGDGLLEARGLAGQAGDRAEEKVAGVFGARCALISVVFLMMCICISGVLNDVHLYQQCF